MSRVFYYIYFFVLWNLWLAAPLRPQLYRTRCKSLSAGSPALGGQATLYDGVG